MVTRSLAVLIFLFSGILPSLSQNKYQSLMWKISGNGLEKPSYLYGTMHISGKMVFHLGDQFYQAMQNVDVVALELEPELWLKSIFSDPKYRFYTQSDNSSRNEGFAMDYYEDSPLPVLKGRFSFGGGVQERLKEAIMSEPALLNYLLFRFGDYGYGADFEEDTWLDMYIYQTGKKLGKQTLGLETYEQSDYYIRQAQLAEFDSEDRREYDAGDMKELADLQGQLEPAYRNQNLDLIDSLNKKTTSPAFNKYILLERNKVFIHTIDSVLKSGKTIFAGMGCAHLPGEKGVIEILRGMGYSVEPINKGERNAKQRNKLDKVTFKRDYSTFESVDKAIAFDAPSKVYQLGADNLSSDWICLDIPNGASFSVSRMKTYAGLSQRSQEDILRSVDSVLYEAIAGDIISIKRTQSKGFPALDIINKSRRGDFQRKLIVVLPEEIVLMKLSAPGEKVKNGYGNEFFNSLNLAPNSKSNDVWVSQDGLISVKIPGEVVCYPQEKRVGISSDFEAVSASSDGNEYYVLQRRSIEDPDFLDEDGYELNRLADAFQLDNFLKEKSRRKISHNGLPALEMSSLNSHGRKVFSRFVLENLGYYAFSVITDDSMKSSVFFKSITFQKALHREFFEYQDTTCYFKVSLPFHPESLDEEALYGGYNRSGKDKNLFAGKIDRVSFSPPGETEEVKIEFQRYHKFSDGEDSLKFYNDKREMACRYGLTMDRASVSWNRNGCVMNFVMSDTACIRKYKRQIVLHNKSLYTITASYDSVLGPGDFITKFFETFQATDTTFAIYHFMNRDEAFLDVLVNGDSTARANAIGISGEMDFSASSGASLRRVLNEFPEIEDEKDREALREKLTSGLAADTTKANISFITSEFYKYSDSAEYQLDLLRVLLRMRTKPAWVTYKKLLMDEPPLVGERNAATGFSILNDSLELSSPLIPDFLALLTLDEYRDDVYGLISEALDSNLIKPDVFKNQLGQITFEAKNELKRLNSMKEGGYSFNTELLIHYCNLLQSYRNQKEVQMFFDKVRRTKKMSLLLDVVDFDLKHKNAVPDSIYDKLLSQEERIIPLYKVLYENKASYKWPAKYSERQSLIQLYLKEKGKNNYRSESTVDSVAVFHHFLDTIKGKSVEVFYCKYKKEKSKQWLGAVLAFDNDDKSNLWPMFMERNQTVVLDSDEDELEELNNEYKLLIENNRRVLNFGYGTSRMNMQWY